MRIVFQTALPLISQVLRILFPSPNFTHANSQKLFSPEETHVEAGRDFLGLRNSKKQEGDVQGVILLRFAYRL